MADEQERFERVSVYYGTNAQNVKSYSNVDVQAYEGILTIHRGGKVIAMYRSWAHTDHKER